MNEITRSGTLASSALNKFTNVAFNNDSETTRKILWFRLTEIVYGVFFLILVI
jgi:hypothetical protein